jgi:hypothetical protein
VSTVTGTVDTRQNACIFVVSVVMEKLWKH